MKNLDNGVEIETLNDNNFLFFAAKAYNNVHGDTKEFLSDVKRFKYLKKLFTRYKTTGELKERLILNHIIILYNVFGVNSAGRMLFLKLNIYKEQLKPFLVLLSVLPKVVYFGKYKLDTDDIISDSKITEALRKI